MKLRATVALARRESRSSWRRLLLYMGSIVAGVAALVALSSFRASVEDAVAREAKVLLGADVRVESRVPFTGAARDAIAAIEALGLPASYITELSSMALSERSRRTRMVHLHAVAGDFPFYGEVETSPPGLWPSLRAERRVLVDPSALLQLDAAIGDVLSIGQARFTIAGTILRAPGASMALQTAIAPRVYLAAEYLDETELITVGSIVEYAAALRVRDTSALDALLEERRTALRAMRVRAETAAEYGEDLTESFGRLASFLSLVGLVALLLGAVGVATGVHVFATEKLDTAAVLRCLGARPREILAIYVLQAGVLGLLGSAAGVALGVAAQAAIPLVLRDFLPMEVRFAPHMGSLLFGLGAGVWVAVLFALPPLLRVRRVAPLRALRSDYESAHAPSFDAARLATFAAMAASGLGVCLWQAPRLDIGGWFALGLVGTALALGVSARVLMAAARRLFPERAPYWMRQGVANLFRPKNQTLAVILGLGLGVFLIGSLQAGQHTLLGQINLDRDGTRPNLAVFDIQPTQEEGVIELLRARDATILEQTPIIPARIFSIETPRGILRASTRIAVDVEGGGEEDRRERWALRRQHRLTYRFDMRDTERLTAGTWWSPADAAARGPDALPGVSLEERFAEDLGVGIGDRIVWDIQGVPVPTEVRSLRRVDWGRLATNFFAVIEPGAIDLAPRTAVVVAKTDDPAVRAALQSELVGQYPNVSVIDATAVVQAVDLLLRRVSFAVRFMALFALLCGVVILIGAISTARAQRVREAALLRTLGADARTIRRVLCVEYGALGGLAGLVGAGLAAAVSTSVSQLLFEQPGEIPVVALLSLWAVSTALCVGVGLLLCRDMLTRTPLDVLRST
jgi:putative ABC transport system permease protein